MSQIAKIFTNGGSQVRLPAAFRFDTSEVFVRRDPATGDVILSRRPADWGGFWAAHAAATVPAGFLASAERAQASGAVLVTQDQAFGQVQGLKLADWTV